MFKYTKEIIFADNTSHGELLKLVDKGSVVLEFGCATGKFAGYIKENLDCKVYGIELVKSALDEAMPVLERGICCDVESHPWENEFLDVKFDILLFADVLEHLKHPASVISRALSLLKDDGKILFSVPNVAHADIVLKLLNNRFDYTDIGLLDDTHIRFFAKESIAPFCKEASIFPTYVTATTAPAHTTEQRLDSAVGDLFNRAIASNELSDVYQFVVCAKKADFSNEETVWNLPSKSSIAKFYFGDENGFSEEKAICVPAKTGKLDLTVNVPEGSTSLRIDIREDSGYILKGLCIKLDGVEAKISEIKNLASSPDGKYFLFESDPQIFVELPKNTSAVSLSGELTSIFESEDILHFPAILAKECQSQAAKLEQASERIKLTDNHVENLNAEISRLNKESGELGEQINELNTKVHSLESAVATLKEKEEELLESKSALEADLGASKKQYAILDTQMKITSGELDHYKTHYFAAINQREELKAQLALVQEQYNVISSSQFWKITKPLRVLFDLLKWPFRHIKPLILVAKFFKTWRELGLKTALKKVFKRKVEAKKATEPLYTKEELEAQKLVKFKKDIKFSILVPLYNTPEKFLCEMIESVIDQTYANWELCLADGSDDKHGNVAHIVQKYAKKDPRIVYKKLEKNLGISGNTNACIEMSTGDYISLFDHDDLLHPAALYNVMEAICEQDADFIYTDENTFHFTPADAYCPHFKPDYAPDTLRTNNYICHFTSFDKKLLDEVGVFRPECDGSQDYDMVLRLTEKAKKIVHIPKILYWWRAHAGSVATDIGAKPYVIEAAHRALRDHLDRVGLKGEVLNTVVPSIYKIKYEIKGEPLVSIIIANKDHVDDLEKCINSIVLKSTYKNYEIVVVENNSTEKETFDYYDKIKADFGVKVITWESNGKFNYSAINNLGVKESKGEYVILLNNDTEIISPEWIEEMLMFAQRPDVGAVGAKLYYPDNTIQHAGIGMGLLTLAGHYFKGFHRNDPGYMGRLIYAHNVSAVTAACVMVPRRVWDEIDGLDETFEVAFNDVDMCMRIRKNNYLIIFTPFCELYHYESKSRGLDTAPEKRERFVGEVTRFQSRWRKELDAGDPYYNPNFTLDKEDFSLR